MRRSFYSKLLFILVSFIVCAEAYALGESEVETDVKRNLLIEHEKGYLKIIDAATGNHIDLKDSAGKKVRISNKSLAFELMMGGKAPTADRTFDNLMTRNIFMDAAEKLTADKIVPGAGWDGYLVYGMDGNGGSFIISTIGGYKLDFNKGFISIGNKSKNSNFISFHEGDNGNFGNGQKDQLTLDGIGLISIQNLGGFSGKEGFLYGNRGAFSVKGDNVIFYGDKAAIGIGVYDFIKGSADDNVAVRLGSNLTKNFLVEASEFTTAAGNGAFIFLDGNAFNKKVVMELEGGKVINIRRMRADHLILNAGSIEARNEVRIYHSGFTKALFASESNYHGQIDINFAKGLGISGSNFADNVAFIAGSEEPQTAGQYDTAIVNIKGSNSIVGNKGKVSGKNKGTYLIKNRNDIVFDAGVNGRFTILDNKDSKSDKVQSIMLVVEEDVLSNDFTMANIQFKGNNSSYNIDGIGLRKIVTAGVYKDIAAGDIENTGGLKITVDQNVSLFLNGTLEAHEIDFGVDSTYLVKANDIDITAGKIKLMGGKTAILKGKIKIGAAAGQAKLDFDFIGDVLNLNGTKEYVLFKGSEFDIDGASHANSFFIVNPNLYYTVEFDKGGLRDDKKIKVNGSNAKGIRFDGVDNRFYANINGAGEAEIKDYDGNDIVIVGGRTKDILEIFTFSDSVYINEKRSEALTGAKKFSKPIFVNKADGTVGGRSDIITLTGAYEATFSNDFIAIGNKIADGKALISHIGDLVIGDVGKTVAFIRNYAETVGTINKNVLIKSAGNVNLLGNVIFNGNNVSRGIEFGNKLTIGNGRGELVIEGNSFKDQGGSGLTAFAFSSVVGNEIKIDVGRIAIGDLKENFNFNNEGGTTKNLTLKVSDCIIINGSDKNIMFYTSGVGDEIKIETTNVFHLLNINNSTNAFVSQTNLNVTAGGGLILQNIAIVGVNDLFQAGNIKVNAYSIMLENTAAKVIEGNVFEISDPADGVFDISTGIFEINGGGNIDIRGTLFLSADGESVETDKIKIRKFTFDGGDITGAHAKTGYLYKMKNRKTLDFGFEDGDTVINNVEFAQTPFLIGEVNPVGGTTNYDDKVVNINGNYTMKNLLVASKAVFTINGRKEILFKTTTGGNFDVYNNDVTPAIVVGVHKDVLLNAIEMAEVKFEGYSKVAIDRIVLMKVDGGAYSIPTNADINIAGGLKLSIGDGVTYEILNHSEHSVSEVNFAANSKLLFRVNADGSGNDGKFVSLDRGLAAEVAKITGKIKLRIDVETGSLASGTDSFDLHIFDGFDISLAEIELWEYPNYYLEFDAVNKLVKIEGETERRVLVKTEESLEKLEFDGKVQETTMAFVKDDWDGGISNFFRSLVANVNNNNGVAASRAKMEKGVRAINPIEEASLVSAVGETASNIVHVATNYVSINRLGTRNNSKIVSNYVLVADNSGSLGGHKFIEGDPLEVWAKYLFNFGFIGTNSSETKSYGNGFIVGVDKGFFSNKVKAGIAFMPNWDKLKNDEREIGVMSLAASLYSRTNLYRFANNDEVYINNTIGYVHSFNTESPIGVGKEMGLKDSKYSGNAFTIDAIAGYRFDNLELSTEFGLKYTYLNQNEYKNGAGNKVDKLDRNVLTMVLGIKYDIPEDTLIDNLTATIAFDIDYDVMSIGDDKYTITTPKKEVKYMISDSNKANRFGSSISFDVSYEVIDNLKLSIGYGLRLASKFTNNTISLGVRYNW